ncbi:MAG: transporter [Magnetospirillum sp.]|nr:transporter [Magnetospirillum sp.]
MWTFIRNNGIALTAGLAAVLASGQTLAAENWTPHLPGVTEGLPAGALPPPGFYFLNTTMVAPFSLYDNNGDTNGVKADIFVDVPMLLWNPGVKVLGADYAVGVAQPITHVSASGGGLDESSWGLFQTILMPAKLAWQLPADFHVSAGLAVYVPDGTAQKTVISYQNGTYRGVPNSTNYWALEPSLGISWLHDGWNVSASFNYDINFKNQDSGYTSGNALVGDYTITKAIGAWTVGVGGYSVNQLEDDKSEVAAIQAGINAADGNRQTKYAAGPIVGYDFGKASVTAYYNHGFGAKNVLSGDTLWTRLVVPF